jgi:hypothetical protein
MGRGRCRCDAICTPRIWREVVERAPVSRPPVGSSDPRARPSNPAKVLFDSCPLRPTDQHPYPFSDCNLLVTPRVGKSCPAVWSTVGAHIVALGLCQCAVHTRVGAGVSTLVKVATKIRCCKSGAASGLAAGKRPTPRFSNAAPCAVPRCYPVRLVPERWAPIDGFAPDIASSLVRGAAAG